MTLENVLAIFFILLAFASGYRMLGMWRFLPYVKNNARLLLLTFMIMNAALTVTLILWVLIIVLFPAGQRPEAVSNAIVVVFIGHYAVLIIGNWLAFHFLTRDGE